MFDTVLYEVEDKIATITLNRPEALNALNRQLRSELGDTLELFDHDSNAWVAIITGAGRAFCAGRDLKERADDNAAGREALATDSLSNEHLSMWPPTQKPMIAAVNGYALAGGWGIAQICDIRIASDQAKLGISEPRVGLLPPFAIQLNRLIPEAAVMELVMTADPFPAQRVLEMGFLNKVVPAEHLMETARDIATAIVKNAPLSVRTFKDLVLRSRHLDEPGAAKLTIELYDHLLKSRDAREGPRAFAEKRPPNWQAQ